MERLRRLVRGASHSLYRDQQQVDLLDNLLQKAEVRPLRCTPKSVVRMRSSVQVRDIRTLKEGSMRLFSLTKQTRRWG
jgi:hypothetical protein